jgi:hypothetical protein
LPDLLLAPDPANLGYEVVYGSLDDCVASAVTGRVRREEQVWQ